MSKNQRSDPKTDEPEPDDGELQTEAPGTRRRRRVVDPIIRLPAGRFRLTHCPNRHCDYYEERPGWRTSLWGFYESPACLRPIPRYRCLHCKRTFTARTFAATYWLHRWDLFARIAQASVGGSGVRQIARSCLVAHSTVARHLTRAGRYCLVFHRQMLRHRTLRESLAFDGFESFEHSQFFPCHYNLAAGRESWFIYHFTHSQLRRKGSMTDKQKVRRKELEAELGRPDPKAVENGIFELLSTVLRMAPGKTRPDTGPASPPLSMSGKSMASPLEIGTPLELHSDEHPAYPRAIRRLRREPEVPVFRHVQTPSTAARTHGNPLFPVNLVDLLLRHCSAGHRRETIAFDKRLQGGLERAAIFTVWRNTIKWQRERRPGETAAMVAGVLSRRLGWKDVFAQRRFPRESELPGSWWEYYWRRIKTAALGDRQTENRAVFAF